MFFYKLILIIGDILLLNISFFLALILRFDAQIPAHYFNLYITHCLVLNLIHMGFNLLFKLYKSLIRYITIRDLFYLGCASLCSGIVFFMYGTLLNAMFPRTVYAIYLCVLYLMMLVFRCSYQIYNKLIQKYQALSHHYNHKVHHLPLTRTLIIGAGDAAHLIITESKKHSGNYQKIVLALDDDKSKWSSSLDGVPIKGPIANLKTYTSSYAVDQIIIAIPSASKSRIREILEQCSDTSCELKIFPGIPHTLTEDSWLSHIRSVSIEDLLGREEITLHNTEVSNILNAHTILVTGGGGSIGSELCRQIVAYHPKKLIIFDIYENNAYNIQQELLQSGISKDILTLIIGSVRDKTRLNEVFATYRPDIVFHAAAHKHVPLMEDNPSEAIKNNIFGTYNVAICAKDFKAKKFILISTDKAVNPTNVMGATKRFCEMIIQSLDATTSATEFVAVRFGNVLGSNGSVIPLFKKQLEAGGPLTVTHPNIIRYFMTIPEAVSLILQATSFATGGEIFVLDMGEPIKILDLAINFIKLSGFQPYTDMDIIFTGLRPGEKLYEELLMEEEGLRDTHHSKIFVGKSLDIPFATLQTHLDFLEVALSADTDLRHALKHVVPTYQDLTSTLHTLSTTSSTKYLA